MANECLDIITTISRGQVEAMAAAGRSLDPGQYDSCEVFRHHVREVQAALVYRYAITALLSMGQSSPESAANLWKETVGFCDETIKVLWKLKDLYSGCGTTELYDLALDYRQQAQERYQQNLEDSECQTPIPKGLFPNPI